MVTKMQLILQDSKGNSQGPVTESFLVTVYNALPENTADEIGAKLMIALCLYGVEDVRTQTLGVLSQEILKSRT